MGLGNVLCAVIASTFGMAVTGGVADAAAQSHSLSTIVQMPYPAGAMLPTIHPGDTLDIDIWNLKPARGDIVVFDFPGFLCIDGTDRMVRSGDHTCVDPKKPVKLSYFAMRVIGMPGDRIVLKGDQLVVNEELVPVVQVGPFEGSHGEESERLMLEMGAVVFTEHLFGKDHQIARMPRYTKPVGLPNDRVPSIVPAGCYLVLGDNRDNALDSRWWGCVSAQKIRGIVVNVSRPNSHQKKG